MAGRNDEWSVKAALDWTVGFLEERGDEHPRRSAEWLMSAATGLSRVEIYAYFDRPLSLDERTVLREGVKRRATGEPLQYVTGEVAFRHIVMRTRKGVLIPRPETEVLVDRGLLLLDQIIAHGEDHEDGATGASSVRVLDMCTGSGCVALSIAQERPCVHVVATDISPDAVALARENAEALRLTDRVEVIEADLASPYLVHGEARPLEYFDLIISNPPYIPRHLLDDLPNEVVGFEPRLALDGGADGLAIFARIVEQARLLLKPGGSLVCELHEDTFEEASLLCTNGFKSVTVSKDLTGRERILSVQRIDEALK